MANSLTVKQAVQLSMTLNGVPPTLHMVQGDANSRTIVATLWDGAQLYSIPAGAAIMVSPLTSKCWSIQMTNFSASSTGSLTTT